MLWIEFSALLTQLSSKRHVVVDTVHPISWTSCQRNAECTICFFPAAFMVHSLTFTRRLENSFNMKENCSKALRNFTSRQFSFNRLLPQLHSSTCSLKSKKQSEVKNVSSIFRAKPSSSFVLLLFPQ